LFFAEEMLPLTGAEMRKYLTELEKSKNPEGYVSSNPVWVSLRKLKRKEAATKGDAGVIEVEDSEGAGDGNALVQADSPLPKKARTGKGAKTGGSHPVASLKLVALPWMMKLWGLSGIQSSILGGMLWPFAFLSVLMNLVYIVEFIHVGLPRRGYLAFCRYMSEQVPFAKVDVDAAVKAKFSDLVSDAGTAALRVLLMSHAMELKYGTVEKKH
jgi:hypothetical protein